jgi:hypothetical protein
MAISPIPEDISSLISALGLEIPSEDELLKTILSD